MFVNNIFAIYLLSINQIFTLIFGDFGPWAVDKQLFFRYNTPTNHEYRRFCP